MAWQYLRVDHEHALKQDFPEGYPVDAWCEATKLWRRGFIEEKISRQEDGSANGEPRWTIRCEHGEHTFPSGFVCDTAVATKELLDHFGGGLNNSSSFVAHCVVKSRDRGAVRLRLLQGLSLDMN